MKSRDVSRDFFEYRCAIWKEIRTMYSLFPNLCSSETNTKFVHAPRSFRPTLSRDESLPDCYYEAEQDGQLNLCESNYGKYCPTSVLDLITHRWLNLNGNEKYSTKVDIETAISLSLYLTKAVGLFTFRLINGYPAKSSAESTLRTTADMKLTRITWNSNIVINIPRNTHAFICIWYLKPEIHRIYSIA